MDRDDQAILLSIVETVSPNIPSWFGKGAVMQAKSVRWLVYPYSFFLRIPVRTPDRAQALLAKIHRKPHMATVQEALSMEPLRSAGRDEFAMTQAIWHVFEEEGSPAFTAVQPFAFLEEWNAIMMREVDGTSLKSHLLSPYMAVRSPEASAQFRQFLAGAAHWLRIFHQRVAGARHEPFPMQDAEETAARVLDGLAGHVDVSGYRSALTRKLEGLRGLQVPVALLHDDFQYSNILVETGGRVCVLDYALNHRSCVYSDVATLLIDPRTRGLQVWSDGWLISQRTIRSFDEVVLRTYFEGNPYSRSVLEFFCGLAILNKWNADERDLSSRPPAFGHFLLSRMRRYYKKLLMEYF